MSTIQMQQGSRAVAALYSRINWRLLPLLIACYMFAYLDRVNVGFAKLQMQSDLGFSDAAYGVGAGIFFIGYVLFEIPSNLMLPRIGARLTFSRILVLWGITSACMLFVRNVPAFYAMRFLLGVFEAGFAPGMIYYLSRWYGPKRMARAIALVFVAGPIGGVVGGPLSAWLMSSLAGVGGLSGWQWMFLVEGLPCLALGALVWFTLANRPADARWLTSEEKRLVEAEVGGNGGHEHRIDSFSEVLRNPRVYRLALAYFCIIFPIYAMSFWLPTLIKEQGVNDTLHSAGTPRFRMLPLQSPCTRQDAVPMQWASAAITAHCRRSPRRRCLLLRRTHPAISARRSRCSRRQPPACGWPTRCSGQYRRRPLQVRLRRAALRSSTRSACRAASGARRRSAG